MKIISKLLIAIGLALIIPASVFATVAIVPQGGTGTSTFPVSQLLYGSGANPIQSVSTTTASCSGSASCSPFIVIGNTPISISASGGSGFDFPFTLSNFGSATSNSTSTLIGFNSGLYSLASSTMTASVTGASKTAVLKVIQEASWQSGGGGDNYALSVTGYSDFGGVRFNGADGQNAIYDSVNNTLGFTNNVGFPITFSGFNTMSGANPEFLRINTTSGEIRGTYFTASTTIASTFPYASTTVLSASTLCLSTDCRTAWPSAGASSVGPLNVLQASNGSGGFIATGTPQLTVGYLVATSTIATSTFSGNVAIGGRGVIATGNLNTGVQFPSFSAGSASDSGSANIGTLISKGVGSIALGYAVGFTSGVGTISSSGSGSLAGGFAQSTSLGATNITSTNNGSFAWGAATGLFSGGTITSSGVGSVAMGHAGAGLSIISSGDGSFAAGLPGAGSVTASNSGAFAFGDNLTSSASLAISFGSGFTTNTANTFQVGYSSTPTLTVNANNMGVGSTSPFAKLSVKGAGSTTGINFQTTNSSNLPLVTGLDNGNVGIGTTSPYAKLSLFFNTTNTLTNNTPAFLISSTTRGIAGNQPATTTLFIVTPTNKVGIGTTSPMSNLSVQADNSLRDVFDNNPVLAIYGEGQHTGIIINGGQSATDGQPVTIQAASGNAGGFNGGDLNLLSGIPTSGATPGNVNISTPDVGAFFTNSGDININTGIPGIAGVMGRILINSSNGAFTGIGTVSPDSSLDVSGTFKLEGASSVESPSIGGAIIGTGCDTGDTTTSGLASTTALVTTPESDPGGAVSIYSLVLNATTVRTFVCSAVTLTPNTVKYRIKIIR